MSERQRIAVTGLGIVSAIGQDQDEVWSHALAGRGGFGQVDLFDVSGCRTGIAGQIRSVTRRGRAHPGSARRASRTDTFCGMSATEAVAQAGLSGSAVLEQFGVALGSSTAGMLEAEGWARAGFRDGFGRLPISRTLRVPTSAPTDVVAALLGAGGPRWSNMTACASSALAIGQAADLIRAGDAPGMIAGGGDALCLMTFAGFNALRLLDTEACRPFDARRRGLSLGEGAGVMVLEHWEHALARGARPLAEFLDYGASCDAYHMTAPHPEGRAAVAAMRQALVRSKLSAEHIGHINAHGTGTRLNDAAEARAIRVVFGAAGVERIPVTSSKSLFGHVLGGSGGLEAVMLVLSLIRQMAPPTVGWESAEASDVALDVVTGGPRRLSCSYAMSNSFGFGGANCSLVFGTVA